MLLIGLKGASPSEILIEAARRNNTDLLQQVIDEVGNTEKAAILLNETKSVLGNYIYHEAALRGNCTHFLFVLFLMDRLLVSLLPLHTNIDQRF